MWAVAADMWNPQAKSRNLEPGHKKSQKNHGIFPEITENHGIWEKNHGIWPKKGQNQGFSGQNQGF